MRTLASESACVGDLSFFRRGYETSLAAFPGQQKKAGGVPYRAKANEVDNDIRSAGVRERARERAC
jgi:hypothetical protein